MQMPTATGYTLTTTTNAPFAEAVERVRAELKQEGFGVLCEIDVQATLREKLGVEQEPYTILGACNPPLAHQALSAEPELGTLLPCNVVVYERDGETHISAIDAERMLSIVGNDELAPIAAQVRAKLAAVVERASTTASQQQSQPSPRQLSHPRARRRRRTLDPARRLRRARRRPQDADRWPAGRACREARRCSLTALAAGRGLCGLPAARVRVPPDFS